MKGWGRNVRVRIMLRKQLGREPTERELKAGFANIGNQYKDGLTAEDVKAAYDSGKEVSL
jgi:hypothetical protein